MRITVEISLYPLDKDFIPPIMDFLARLKSHKELEIVTNAASTLIGGEHASVFNILSKETEKTFSSGQPAIFVMKVIGFERDIQKKY